MHCHWGQTPRGLLSQNCLYQLRVAFRLQVHERVRISLAELYGRVEKCVISACKKAQNG